MTTITESIVEDAATASWCGCTQIGTTITRLRCHRRNATQTVLAQAEVPSEGWAG